MRKFTYFFLVFILLLAALAIRTTGLKLKFYWMDEVSSSFLMTGHAPSYIEARLDGISGQITTVDSVTQFLEDNPQEDPLKIVETMAAADPQHSPLYLLMSHAWSKYFGAQPESIRLLAVLLGFLGIPLIFWLVFEMTTSKLSALLSMALLTFAPFHILYCQQNREYSLWFTTTILSTALLLYANRVNRIFSWILYGVSVAIGLYSFLFFLPFLICHALYQLTIWERNEDRRLKYFIFSGSLGTMAFLPWLVNMLRYSIEVQELNQWSLRPLEPSLYIQGLILNFSRLFADFNLQSFQPLPWDHPLVLLSILFICAVIIASFIFTIKKFSSSNKVLILSMLIVPFAFLFALDLVLGGRHALVGRHLMPAWIATYAAVGIALASGLESLRVQYRWITIFVSVVLFFSLQLFSLNIYLNENGGH